MRRPDDAPAAHQSTGGSLLDSTEGSDRGHHVAPPKVSRRKFLRTSGLTLGAATLFPLAGIGGGGLAVPSESLARGPITNPDELFRLGLFEKADRGYRWLLRKNPENAHAAARRGYIALLSNRFEDAETFLKLAIKLAPYDQFSKLQLADTFVRQNQLTRAVPLLGTLDERSQAQAKAYASITGRPYQVAGALSTQVPFPALDPLPHFHVSVNGRDPEYFVFDTGAVLSLKKETAEAAGLHAVATSKAFVAGQDVTLFYGVAHSIRIGEIELRNVPVSWPDEIRFPELPDGTSPAGVVGTDIFYRFLTTLDFAHKKLVLRRKTRAQLRRLRAEARRVGAEVLPLWLATDRLACTLGSLNDYGPRVVLLDTGAIGIGVITTEQFAQRSGVDVDRGNPGPGGFYPIVADKISLGDAVRRNVPGIVARGESRGPLDPNLFTFEVIAAFTHEFYKPFAVTFDFADMNLYITGPLQ
jgi:predicted aspartyl protease